MKKLLGYSLLLTLLFSFSCVFFSCDSDSDPEPEPPTNSIVGQWKGSFSNGYQIIIFNSNGTYRLLEYDSGEWQFDDTGEYSYNATKGILKLKEDDDDNWDTFEISSLDKDKFIIKNYEDGRDWVFYRNSDPLPEPGDNGFVGKWKSEYHYGDNDEYDILVFEKDGSARDIVYDNGECVDDDLATYEYDKKMGTLSFIYKSGNGTKTTTVTVVSLKEKDTFVLKDKDGDTFTYHWYTGAIPDYPAVNSNNNSQNGSLIGTWNFTDIDNEEISITFFENGTYAYFLDRYDYAYVGYYQQTADSLIFTIQLAENISSISSVKIMELSENSFVFEGYDTQRKTGNNDTRVFNGIYRGTKESKHLGETTSARYKNDIVGEWNVEAVYQKYNVTTFALSISNNGTFKWTDDNKDREYNGVYSICDNKILFLEQTQKCPMGGLHTIKELSESHFVLANVYNQESVGNISNSSNSDNAPAGVEAVDLGLSVKWASCNLGATTPTASGDYFNWGSNEYIISYESPTMSNICGTSYDVARNMWGGTWRLPTRAEVKELLEKCSKQWTTQNGVKGFKFSRNGKSIFLPAAGYFDGEEVRYADNDYWSGCYWTGTQHETYKGSAWTLSFDDSEDAWEAYEDKRGGLSVRPVKE